MDQNTCNKCGKCFTSQERHEQHAEADVVEQQVWYVMDGQYMEWAQVICPECESVVTEYRR